MTPGEGILPVHCVAAAGLVFDDEGRVLLIRHPRRGWTYPGGMVEQGETLLQAAVREIREESGVTAQLGELMAVASNVARRPGYNGVKEIPTVVNFVFLARAVSGEPCPSEESAESGWFTLEQAEAMVTAPASVEVFRAYREYQGRPLYLVYRTWPEFELMDKTIL